MKTRITELFGIEYPIICGECSGWQLPNFVLLFLMPAAWVILPPAIMTAVKS